MTDDERTRVESIRDALQSKLRTANRSLRDGKTDHARSADRRFRLISICPGRSAIGENLSTEFCFADLDCDGQFVTIPQKYNGYLEVTDDLIEECRVLAAAVKK